MFKVSPIIPRLDLMIEPLLFIYIQNVHLSPHYKQVPDAELITFLACIMFKSYPEDI